MRDKLCPTSVGFLFVVDSQNEYFLQFDMQQNIYKIVYNVLTFFKVEISRLHYVPLEMTIICSR